MKTAILFSGQGGQQPGMMRDLIDTYPAARELFDTASALLGRDIYALTMEGTQEELDRTENTQPCVLACELAAFRVYRQLGLPFDAVVGFSLGEWAALSACGAAAEEDVLQLIASRAAAMQRAVPLGEGAMAAILGQNEAFVQELCQAVGDVGPANYNCPGNITVSGTAAGIDRLLKTADEQDIMATRVPVSVPSHCPLLTPAVEELQPVIQTLSLREPQVNLVMNATGKVTSAPEEIRENLIQQLVRPVLFQQSVELLFAQGYDCFVELGPGKTLSNMVKRTAKAAKISVQILQLNSLEGVEKVKEALGI